MHQHPVIAVDIGNSSLKFGLFETVADQPLPLASKTLILAPNDDWEVLENWAPNGCQWIVASVQRETQRRFAHWLAAREGDSLLPATHENLPIAANVDRPDHVGADRLAGAAAARLLQPESRPAIVIDSGSAITIDYVSAAGVFEGGAILPGVGMASRFLAEGTDLLPLADVGFDRPPPAPIGKNTSQAIASGLILGTLGGIEHIVTQMTKQSAASPLILCTGGDGKMFSQLLPMETTHEPDLILQGIALIARRNV